MLKQLDPMLDVVFKMLFTRPGSEEILRSLLADVLHPPSPIQSVVVLNPELEKDGIDDRGVVLDLHLQLTDGTRLNVEMQAQRRDAMRERMLYHWARMYGGRIERGDDYSGLQRCVSVFLLGYNELPRGRFHSTFEVLERHDHERLTDHLQLHLVQLRRLPAVGSDERASEGRLVDWARFFGTDDESERRELAMSDPVFSKAVRTLDELSADPVAQRLAREREEAHFLYRVELNAARMAAREEGLTQGREEGRAEGREEGREVLRSLALRRFGEVSPQALTLIASATTAQLTTWTSLLFESASAEEWVRAMAESQ